MLALMQSLLLNSMMLSVLSWQGSALEKLSLPLTDEELRENLHRLVQLESVLSENEIYRAYIEREAALAKKEQANSDEALRLANEATRLAQKETELQRERADFYENAYKTIAKGRSKKCTILKIFTLGLARCQ